MKWQLGLAVVVCSVSLACGDDPKSRGGDGGDGVNRADGGGGNGGMGGGGMGGGAIGAGVMATGGSGPSTCSEPMIPSGCGKPQSIVRVLATLADGNASGPLRV